VRGFKDHAIWVVLGGAVLSFLPWVWAGDPVEKSAPREVRVASSKAATSEFQRKFAKHHHLALRLENGMGMIFVLVPPGRYVMGLPKEDPQYDLSEAAHEVEITTRFYMQETEVTDAQYRHWRERHSSDEAVAKARFPSAPTLNGDTQPVVGVSYDEVEMYAAWLTDGAKGYKYRLPTEAEWEYACRGGTQGKYYWGDDPEGGREFENMLFDEDPVTPAGRGDAGGARNLPTTSSVGSLKPNPWGLYDMLGNVSEWCEDWFYPVLVTVRWASGREIKYPRLELRCVRGGTSRGGRAGGTVREEGLLSLVMEATMHGVSGS